MKRFTLLVAAVAALFATSCVKEQLSDVQVNGADAIVSFSVAAPELGSRAIGDGLKATHLVYAVYDEDWNYLTEGTATFNNLVANVSLRLVNNKEYNFAFWASVEGNAYYTFNTATATVEVDYSGAANDENRDAFWGHKTGLVVNGTMNETVQLYRPFAQVNWGTNDVEAARIGGFDITTTGTAVYEAEAYTTLSLKDGSVGGLQNVTFTAANLVSNTTGEALVTASLGNYTWLAMNYLLWSADQGTLTVNKLTVTDNVGQQVVVSYPNANVQRNYRTNLVGSLLTDQVNIVVEIVPVFDGEYTNEELPVKVTSADQLRSEINSTPIGDTKDIVLAAGTYEGLFNVQGNKTVNISSVDGAVIDGLVNAMDWATVTLNGLTLQNTNNVGTNLLNRDDQKGACVGAYVANITLVNCTLNVLQTIGGIYIDADRTDGWAADWDGYNLRVKNCVFNCQGNRPIQCRANVLIDGCTFNDQYRYSAQIRFNPADASEKVTFTNNTIVDPCVTSGKPFAAGLSLKTSDEVKDVVFDIAGNTMQSSLFTELLYVYDNANLANLHLDTCTIPSGVTFVPEP